MSRGWTYVSGDWNLICDSCSKKVKASKTKQRWDGFQVCSVCWETRHPQDFVKATIDRISVPFSRPQPTDIFLDVNATRANSDNFTLTEAIIKNASIIVTNVLISGSDTANQSIGSFALGEYPLGGQGAVQGYTQEIGFTESFSLGYDIVKNPTDSIGFTETYSQAETEGGYSDSMLLSESVVVISYINNALGEITLGATTLG